MTIRKLVSGSFVLLRAEWAVSQSLDLINRLGPTHVIVRHCGSPSACFLYARGEALDLLERQGASATLLQALDLEVSRATPLVESSESVETAPSRCVVTEGGIIIGFLDKSYRPRSKRGGTRGGDSNVRNLEASASLNPSVLVAELPKRVTLGETVSLLVYLSTEPAPDITLPIALPQGEIVDVVVQSRRGFALVTSGEGQLTVSGEKEALPLQFKIKALAPGPGLVRVFAFHKGQPLGVVALSPMVVEADAALKVTPMRDEQPLALATSRPPDLSLLILEETVNSSPAISLWLTATAEDLGLNFKKYGPVSLRVDPVRYFREFFRDIENLPLGSNSEKAVVAARLAAKGTNLFETIMPESLRADIWKLRRHIKSVEVLSEEPWVPWELCKMSGQENGRVVEGPFFCEAFDITRWLPGISRKQNLSLKNVAVVMPQDSGLPYAQVERDYMLSLTAADRRISRIPAMFLDVRSALASGEYDGLHFSGHGIFRDADPNRSAMILENRGELTPEDLSGVVRNLGRARPIVFLNACQIGRSAMSLTDVGGWANQFLRAGAGAFIGAYWSVYDKSACDFAKFFYDRLLQGTPIGVAAREARSAVKPAGDSTWLAYTVFADPLAGLYGLS